jgi:hypothetical protein
MRTTYTAIVEVATRQRLDVERLTPELVEYEPEMGTSARGWLELRLTFPATSLKQACATALSVSSAATGAEAIACEVMTTQESRQRQDTLPRQRVTSRWVV